MFDNTFFSASDFSGSVRLFPLPNLVMFPHVMQPLHIFETRYRSLMQDALRSDRLIAMATLASGWESDYEGRPPLRSLACLGQIATYHRLHDGTYNVLLAGLHRVRIVRELAPNRRFREAEVELCEDIYPNDPSAHDVQLRAMLRDEFIKIAPLVREVQEQIDQLLSGDIALGTLTDILSYMLDISLQKKQALLEQLNVVRRAEMVLEHLTRAAQTYAGPLQLDMASFPPQFSTN